MDLSRRQLFVLGASSALVTSASALQRERKPPLPAELVKEFVGAGHGNLDRVKELLAETPALLNATTDHGGGDFETALEGAGHMGNREIALYLIGQGARMNIFQAAMLGELELVQTTIRLHPAALKSKGPHGLDLIFHAKKGGEQAKAVLEFLERESKA